MSTNKRMNFPVKLFENSHYLLQHLIPKSVFFKVLRLFKPNWKFGKKIKWGISSTFIFSVKSTINIGNGVVFSNSLFNPTISKNCKLFVSTGAELSIGDGSGFSGLSLFCSKQIIIGKHLVCGGNVAIWDTDFHQLDSEQRIQNSGPVSSIRIIIGDDVFIGANSTILKGSTIGNRSILGAGSVLRGTVGDDELWLGNPAIFIKKLKEVS